MTERVAPGTRDQVANNRSSTLASFMVFGRRLLRVLPRQKQRQKFEQTYREAVTGIPGVTSVSFRDDDGDLDVYTFYAGDISQVEDQIYDIESAMRRAFPAVRPDWHLVRVTAGDEASASAPEDTVTVV